MFFRRLAWGGKNKHLNSLGAAGHSFIKDLEPFYYHANTIRGFQHFNCDFQDSLHNAVLNLKIN